MLFQWRNHLGAGFYPAKNGKEASQALLAFWQVRIFESLACYLFWPTGLIPEREIHCYVEMDPRNQSEKKLDSSMSARWNNFLR